MGLDRHREAEPSGPPHDLARPFALHRARHRHAEPGGQPQRLTLVERVVEDLGRRRREGGRTPRQTADHTKPYEPGLDLNKNHTTLAAPPTSPDTTSDIQAPHQPVC